MPLSALHWGRSGCGAPQRLPGPRFRWGGDGPLANTAKRILVEDVRQSEIFTGQPAFDVLIEAGVRAVYSTPLISSAGEISGCFRRVSTCSIGLGMASYS